MFVQLSLVMDSPEPVRYVPQQSNVPRFGRDTSMGEQQPYSQAAPAAPADWNLNTVWRLIWGRRWLVVLVAAEVFVVTGLVTFLRTPL